MVGVLVVPYTPPFIPALFHDLDIHFSHIISSYLPTLP